MAGVDLSRLTLEELEALSQQSGSVIAGTPAVSEFFSSKPFTYQREWYDSKKPYQFIFAGNRTGKSKTLIDRLLIELAGVKPAALGGHAPPRWPEGNRKHILCLLASETDETLERNLLPKLRKLVTPEMLEKGVNVNSVKRPWRFRSGAQLYFATYKQSTAALEGSAWHFIGLDEPPPQKWFNAVTRGAIDHQAQVMLAATPLKEPWLLDDMILPSQDSGHTLYGKVDSWNVPMHRNCVLPGSRVAGRFVGGLKARYAGPAVEIRTVHGERLRVTANHPVLTDRGFMAAGDIDKGVALLRQRVEVVGESAGRHVGEQHGADALVEEVFEALAAEGRGVVERLSLDLDGDERFFVGEQVDAVGLFAQPPESGLVRHGVAHPFSNLALELADPALVVSRSMVFPPVAATSLPSARELPFHGNPIIADGEPSHALRLGRVAELDALLPKAALKSLGIAASFYGELLDAFSGHVARDEVIEVLHFDYAGHVYDFATEVGYFASDNILIRNCAACYPGDGALEHEAIMTYLATLPPSERAAREFGQFASLIGLEFNYIEDKDHIVPDFQVPVTWPLVEVVDPAMKRGIYVMWFVVDPDEQWYAVRAAHIDGDLGFRGMSAQIDYHRQKIGKAPDYAMMDARGGMHLANVDTRETWFDLFRREGLRYEPAPAEQNQTALLHDWLKPRWQPGGGQMTPRLRFLRNVTALDRGPLWGLKRFVWAPNDSKKRQYDQPGKDWIDCMAYLATAVETRNLTFQRYASDAVISERSGGLARTYASNGRMLTDGRRTRLGQRRKLASTYGQKDWTTRIERGY